MEHSRIKLEIGGHVFDAEGPVEVVKEQLAIFKEMIANLPPRTAHVATLRTASASPSVSGSASFSPSASASPSPSFDPAENISRITKVEDRIVSLTVKPKSIDEAVLLVLYGQKVIRANDAVTGAEVMSGLTATGIKIVRVDRLLEQASEIGDVIVIGSNRAKRYRLTNSGFAKADALAGELLATVA
jgi:hypothetical protein